VSTPTVEMGRVAARCLVEAIGSGALPPGLVLPTELVVRESVRSATRSSHARARDPVRPAHGASRVAAR
jgi:hypothetical protein